MIPHQFKLSLEEISKVIGISSHNYGVFSNLFKQNKLENVFVCKAGYFAMSKKWTVARASLLFMFLVWIFGISPVYTQAVTRPQLGPIRIGIFQLPPFMMVSENGEAGGIAVDFWRDYLAPQFNTDIEVVGPFPIPRLEIMLERGEIDVIPYITRIPDRDLRFRYPSIPITSITSGIIVRNDSPLRTISRPEDLFGMKIGFITNAFIPPFVQHDQIELELVTSTNFREINHRKLIHRRVDALLDINIVSFIYEMTINGYINDVRVIPLPEDGVPIYSIFNENPRGQILRRLFEEVMTTIPSNTFEALTNRYLHEVR
jgi:hypothetical protein